MAPAPPPPLVVNPAAARAERARHLQRERVAPRRCEHEERIERRARRVVAVAAAGIGCALRRTVVGRAVVRRIVVRSGVVGSGAWTPQSDVRRAAATQRRLRARSGAWLCVGRARISPF